VISTAIQQLVNYGLDTGLILPDDEIYIRNQLLMTMQLDSFTEPEGDVCYADLESILKTLVDDAAARGVCDDSPTARDLFDTRLMGVLTPRPSIVRANFEERYETDGPQAATDWFYKFSQDTDYIRRYRIKRDVKWVTRTPYGDLDITINLSKPEKDPKAIAAAKLAPQSAYPKCQLCVENEGYAGRLNHPARENHRIIPLTINDSAWNFQYSPYVYYNEHCIVFNNQHTPMKIERATFRKLLDFVALFPHYFVGSNADLPIVGGSILSHDHFQGGHYEFAMAKAPIEKKWVFPGFEDVDAGIVHWPMSCIRLTCADDERLVELADQILTAWRGYTDESCFVYAETDGEPHNTITPIARMRDGKFQLDLVLRNNITTPEHPLGVYHPHAKLHHIKKENIGLIEVMGLAVLPSRLKAEMELDQLNTALEEGKNAAAHRGQEIAALEQQLRENTAAAAQAENARKQAEAEIEMHRKELESLGASTSDVTRQREEASQKLSDNRMQKLRTEKDLSLHEAALETLKGRSGEAEARVRELQANVAAAKERIAANELRANEIKRASEENKQKITAAEETIRKANAERMEKEAAVTRLTQENRTLTDERERMGGEMARLAERKTAAETELNTTASKLWEEYQLTEAEAEKLCVPFANVADLRRQVAEVRGKIRALGNVNVGAIEEYKEVKERYDFMKAQVTDVEKSRAELNRMIAELCSEMQEMFTASFKEINRNFGAIFRELFGGGSARLYLSDENDVLNSGIEIQVSPPGKVIKNLSALSGGEQALVAISIYFAILAVNPSPFCILDEIEAALDDVNVTRYAQYLRRMTERTQFIVITHRRGTMEAADVLYGVTMQEDGVSKILRLDLENVSADLIS